MHARMPRTAGRAVLTKMATCTKIWAKWTNAMRPVSGAAGLARGPVVRQWARDRRTASGEERKDKIMPRMDLRGGDRPQTDDDLYINDIFDDLYSRGQDRPAAIQEDPAAPWEETGETVQPVRPRRRRRWAVWLTGAVVCVLLAGAAAWVWAFIAMRPVHDASMEAGDTIRADMFVDDALAGTALGPEAASIDTSRPGEYKVPVIHKGRAYTAALTIVDTVPPTAVGRSLVESYGMALAAADFVEDVQDATAVTATWQQPPDLDVSDPQIAVVRLTDEGGNHTDVQVQLTLVFDTAAPVIEGAKDIQGFVGESVAYREGVTVTDDIDQNPTLTIDNSNVDLNAAGVYNVYYTATDSAGNSSNAAVTLTLKVKPEDYVDEETAYAAARETYDAIIDDGMTDMEKAFAIYRWTKNYIDYWENSSHEYWTVGAYQAFTQRGGDCFIYYSAAKCLLDMAGIENMQIVRDDLTHTEHYWLLINLGDGWYHLDPCPRKGKLMPDHSFMLTDAEMDTYSTLHGGSNIFNPDLYPERAAKSVQYMLDYDTGVVYGDEPAA